MCNYIFIIYVFVTFLSHENISAMRPAPERPEPARPAGVGAVPVGALAVGAEVKSAVGSGDIKVQEILEDIKEEGVLSPQTREIMGEALRAFGVTIPCSIKSTKKKGFYSRPTYFFYSDGSKSAIIFLNEESLATKLGYITWLCYEFAALISLWQDRNVQSAPDSSMTKKSIELAVTKIFEKDTTKTMDIVLQVLMHAFRAFHKEQLQILFEIFLKTLDREGYRIAVEFKPGDDECLETTLFIIKGATVSSYYSMYSNPERPYSIDYIAAIIKRAHQLKIGSWNVHMGKKGFIPSHQQRAGLAVVMSLKGI